MSETPTKIELLSPARNYETAVDAINHGADAVYIGAPRFGARQAAGNSVEDIARLCEYAHIFGVKIYVTLNTIIFEEELPEVEQLIGELYNVGVDALIVQDMGILRMNIPPIALHASTQMDNRNAEKVDFLYRAGFEQVVLGYSQGCSRGAYRGFCAWCLVCQLQRSLLRFAALFRTQCQPWRVCSILSSVIRPCGCGRLCYYKR